jgi:hypothetical protein
VRRLIALGTVLLTAGCAGGGDDEPTRAEWAAEANQICRTYARRIQAVGQPATPAAAAAFVRRAIPLAREEVEKLRALEAPEADAGRIDRMLDNVGQGIDALGAVVLARDSGDEAAVRAATQQGARVAAVSDRIARDLGASACAAQTG